MWIHMLLNSGQWKWLLVYWQESGTCILGIIFFSLLKKKLFFFTCIYLFLDTVFIIALCFSLQTCSFQGIFLLLKRICHNLVIVQSETSNAQIFCELDSLLISRGNAEVPQKQNLLHTPGPAHSKDCTLPKSNM